MALRTRSRLSRTLASGRPTIVKDGRPNDTSTSTWMGQASIPNTAAVRTQASTPGTMQGKDGAGLQGLYAGAIEEAQFLRLDRAAWYAEIPTPQRARIFSLSPGSIRVPGSR